MYKLIVFVLVLCPLTTLMYALDYIESSNGLVNNPQMEGGRTELEMVDINDDGNIDILSIGDHGSPYINTQEHGIMVWFGDGQGNWGVSMNGNFGYGGIAIGDINNDGFKDVGYGMHHNYSGTDFGDSILEAALGDGTGQNWTPWDDGITIGNPNEWGMFCTDFADINNDGYLDLGSNSFGYGDGIHIFINNGDGTWYGCFGFLGGNSTMNFLFGDVDADGNADFCAAHQYGSIYLGDGTGSFILADGNLPYPGNLGRRGPSLGDADNDGDQDFSFCNSDGGIEVWTWQGNNTWSDFSGNLPNSGSYGLTQLYDMNGDGFMDVAAFGSGTVTVWLGDGAGNWTEDVTFFTPSPGYCEAFRVGGDADHNGYSDIVLVSDEGSWPNDRNHVRFYKETSIPESLFVVPVFPRGGETFIAGSIHFITWSCGVPPGETATMRLEFSTTGPDGPWSEIIESTQDNGRYQWSIPSAIQSDDCYIRYTETTLSDTACATTPSQFIISPGTAIAENPSLNIKNVKIEIFPTLFKDRMVISASTFGLKNTSIKIFDNSGNLVRDLFTVNGSGKFSIYWDKKDNGGREVAAGVYFVTIESNEKRLSKKIVVIE
ncbi:MAG: T9SS type A sorting domain-containing protein [candidate division WOR-3 bacterium]|nr:MAG: T9SS type A sorting domain-containing protein [candidate division WOR-3 bacterium]